MLPKSKSKFISGGSLLEVVIALAIFSLIAASFVSLTLGSVSNVSYGTDFLTAETIADQGVGAVRAIRDNAWNTLTDGVENAILDGRFNRTITVSPINLETKSVKVEVAWPSPVGTMQKVIRQTKLTNWDSRDWIQTDWSAPGSYTSVDPTIDTSTAGELKLAGMPITWSIIPTGVPQNLNAVHCADSNNCWAVGAGGRVLRYQSGAWASTTVSTVTWNDVYAVAPNDVYIVGNGGELRRWNGGSWSPSKIAITGINNQNLNSIHCLSASSCWIAGANGRVARLQGSTWSSQTWGNNTWQDINMLTETDGIIVGSYSNINNRNIRRWNGTAWSNMTSSNNGTLYAVKMLSANDAWAAGAAGAVLHWDGTTWSSAVVGSNVWNSINMLSTADGFIVGAGGAIRRLVGGAWTTVISPTTQNLNEVFAFSPNNGWAVGDSGMILRLSGGGYQQSGVLTSSIFDLGDPSPVQIINWDESIPVCVPASACNIKFQIRTGNSTMSDASWPAPPSDFNFVTAAGTLINQSYNGNQYLQYQVQLTGDGLSTPILSEVRINYK
ncbi:MAG: hypothetical protein V1704_02640 [Candidatus Vogelbacteria bacterium]